MTKRDDTRFLELSGISKSYGNSTAIAGLSLDIERGEFVTLLGPSGCGKTTTLRLVAGFMAPDQGTIRIDGRVLSSPDAAVPPEKRDIGMVFQSYAVWPHMSVRANIELPLKIRGMDIGLADDVIRLCRLEHLARRYPGEISGGQLQRVALARALVYQPSLVLLDEPLSNLDVSLREELRREIHRIHQATKATFVLVTHDQVEAMSLSDRIVVMNHGRIEQIGRPLDIYRHPRTAFVAQFVGSANLLQGSVEEVEDDNGAAICRVRCGELLFDVTAWSDAARGMPVTLALHPEAVRIEEATASDRPEGLFEGRVANAFFLGRTLELTIDILGTEIRAVQLRGRVYREGDIVRVSFPRSALIPIGVEPHPRTGVVQRLDERRNDIRSA